MTFTQFSPSNCHTIFGPVTLNGYAEGTFIEIERDEDGFTTYVGALGDVCRIQNLNRLGKITITVMATAPINSVLALMAQRDENNASQVFPILCKDTSGEMRCEGAEAWITKRPKIERSKDGNATVQWEFTVADLKVFEGGNVIEV